MTPRCEYCGKFFKDDNPHERTCSAWCGEAIRQRDNEDRERRERVAKSKAARS